MKTYKQLKESIMNEAIKKVKSIVPSTTSSNKNILQNLRVSIQSMKLKNVNPILAASAHRDFAKLVAANPKAPGYMLMRKLAPNKAKVLQDLTTAGVPLGSALEAHPNDFKAVIQRIKRFR